MSNELEVVKVGAVVSQQGGALTAAIAEQFDLADKVARAVVLAGAIPASYQRQGESDEQTRARLIIGILKGFEIGLQPVTALSTIAVINNRPCLWGDGAKALIQQSGKLEWMTQTFDGEPGKDDRAAVCTMKRIGQDVPYVGRFSVADAKRAQLWQNTRKDPWIKYPQRMMEWRAFSFCARDGFADVLMGLGIAEEVNDIQTTQVSPTQLTAMLDDEAPEAETQPEPDEGPMFPETQETTDAQ